MEGRCEKNMLLSTWEWNFKIHVCNILKQESFEYPLFLFICEGKYKKACFGYSSFLRGEFGEVAS